VGAPQAGPGGVPADLDGNAGLERVLEVLRCFTVDGRNNVWLLSRLPIAGVLSRIAKEVSCIGIVAENGCFIRPKVTPHRSLSGALGMHGGRRNGAELSPMNTVATLLGGWINMVTTFNLTWKSLCVEILNYVCLVLQLSRCLLFLTRNTVHRADTRFLC
jgi:trehalose 6-phosphate synthase/phosphatase